MRWGCRCEGRPWNARQGQDLRCYAYGLAAARLPKGGGQHLAGQEGALGHPADQQIARVRSEAACENPSCPRRIPGPRSWRTGSCSSLLVTAKARRAARNHIRGRARHDARPAQPLERPQDLKHRPQEPEHPSERLRRAATGLSPHPCPGLTPDLGRPFEPSGPGPPVRAPDTRCAAPHCRARPWRCPRRPPGPCRRSGPGRRASGRPPHSARR